MSEDDLIPAPIMNFLKSLVTTPQGIAFLSIISGVLVKMTHSIVWKKVGTTESYTKHDNFTDQQGLQHRLEGQIYEETTVEEGVIRTPDPRARAHTHPVIRTRPVYIYGTYQAVDSPGLDLAIDLLPINSIFGFPIDPNLGKVLLGDLLILLGGLGIAGTALAPMIEKAVPKLF